MALLELLAAAARARIVAADVFQRVADRLLVRVVAVRAVNMAMVVIVMVMIVVAVRAMDMRLLGHCGLLRNKIAGNYHAIALQVHVLADE
ncbi:repressor protein c2 [Pseudomonas sp. Os17]|nr:repressor protein c2 [Pseudomonas sp. Os17]BAQ79213.1 repressor protein c2 [Pseudomonas sp. St29]